ncbi:MAG TPA: cell envelope integrity protein TolA [Steroidobacteraceae bacterium]|nr:cell envelope integrity protein TolA [Steroidobacteraceae bacterium]
MLSILLHSAIVGAAVYGWFTWKHSPPPVQTLAIEATVVDERMLKGIATKPDPLPPAPEPVPAPVAESAPVEEQGPPKPDPAEIERKQEEERLAQEKLEQQKREQDQQAAQELKEREDAERVEAEKQAVARAAAEKAAAEKAAADKKALEKKRAEDAAAAKKAAEEKARVAREAELRRAIEAEERGNAARNSDEAMRWHAQITARIQRAWIKPPSARPGISCIVSVTQVPGGEVTGVRVNSCSIDDAALRESVEAAVLRASPLPTPPAGVPFERNLELTFAPTA